MKFLSSSSSSSASTATTISTSTSFDGSIQTPKCSAAGCISGMVRRLLCRNSLPTYPSDQLKVETQLDLEDVKSSSICLKTENGSSAAPGLVARLMGLESLPPVEKSPNSISRSRSMNSLDSLSSIQGIYRRVKSFREIPTFVQLEDEEFLILSFENEEKRRISRVKSKRRKSIYEKIKENQQPNCKVSNENLSDKIITNSKTPLKDSSNILLHPSQNEMETKRKNRDDDCFPVKRIEAECDSSPNSVLDVSVFPLTGESSRLENSKTRRTLTEELDNYRKLSLVVDTKSLEKQATGKDVKFRRNDIHNHGFVKFWGEISKLVQKEVTESVWIGKWDWKEEFSKQVEVEIVNELLEVLVHQLVQHHN